MTKEEASKWLENLKSDIGKMQFRALWGYEQAMDEIIDLLSADSEWTPCSDRLPSEHICDDGYVEPSEKVLVCTDSGTILTSRYWGNRQSKAEEPDRYADWVDIDWWHNVIAWMPLPKPYGESEVKE